MIRGKAPVQLFSFGLLPKINRLQGIRLVLTEEFSFPSKRHLLWRQHFSMLFLKKLLHLLTAAHFYVILFANAIAELSFKCGWSRTQVPVLMEHGSDEFDEWLGVDRLHVVHHCEVDEGVVDLAILIVRSLGIHKSAAVKQHNSQREDIRFAEINFSCELDQGNNDCTSRKLRLSSSSGDMCPTSSSGLGSMLMNSREVRSWVSESQLELARLETEFRQVEKYLKCWFLSSICIQLTLNFPSWFTSKFYRQKSQYMFNSLNETIAFEQALIMCQISCSSNRRFATRRLSNIPPTLKGRYSQNSVTQWVKIAVEQWQLFPKEYPQSPKRLIFWAFSIWESNSIRDELEIDLMILIMKQWGNLVEVQISPGPQRGSSRRKQNSTSASLDLSTPISIQIFC